jgi:hypothetical protein
MGGPELESNTVTEQVVAVLTGTGFGEQDRATLVARGFTVSEKYFEVLPAR